MNFFAPVTLSAAPVANPVEAAQDVMQAGMGAVQDVTGIVLNSPRTAADIAIWVIEFGRGIPDLVKNTLDGDEKTQDKMAGFAAHAACIVFTLYASLAALNLLLSCVCAAKNGVSKYLVLPTILPAPLSNVRDLVQKNVLDPVINWKHNATFMKLDGQAKSPSLASAASSTSAAISACMILASVPSVLSLMRGGANKGEAEAIAWTLGTALGLQYLVNKVAE